MMTPPFRHFQATYGASPLRRRSPYRRPLLPMAICAFRLKEFAAVFSPHHFLDADFACFAAWPQLQASSSHSHRRACAPAAALHYSVFCFDEVGIDMPTTAHLTRLRSLIRCVSITMLTYLLCRAPETLPVINFPCATIFRG